MNPFSSPKHPRPALGPTNSSHSTDNVDYFLRDKVAGAWSWPLSVLYCQGEELWQPYLCSPPPLRPKCRHGVSLSLTLCWRDLNRILLPKVGRVSSVGIATRYGLDGPWIESRWGARFSPPVQTGPGAHPTFCTMGTGSLPGLKRTGRGADHTPPSKCRGQERVELYLYSPSGPSWPVMGAPFTAKIFGWYGMTTGKVVQLAQLQFVHYFTTNMHGFICILDTLR